MDSLFIVALQPLLVGVLCMGLLCYALQSVLSSSAIIYIGSRELVVDFL